MRRYISIVLALVFMMTSLPANATVQTTNESLLSQVQSFNQENGVIASSDSTTEASGTHEATMQPVPSISGTTPIFSDNVSDTPNYEEEIIETIPVSDDKTSDKEDDSSYKKSARYGFMQREFAKIRRQLAELTSFSIEHDWYAEDINAKVEEPEEEPSAELPEEEFSDPDTDIPADESEDIVEDVPADVSEDIVEGLPADVTEDVIEDVPADVTEDVVEDLPADATEDVVEDVSADVTEDIVEDIPADVTEDIVEDIPADVTEESVTEELPSEPVMFSLRAAAPASYSEASAVETEDTTASATVTEPSVSTGSASGENGSSSGVDGGNTIIGDTVVVPGGATGGGGGDSAVVTPETGGSSGDGISTPVDEDIPNVSCTVTGSVTLPSSAVIAAGSNMYIYAYKAPVIQNGRVVKDPTVYWRRYVNLTAGQRVISFSNSLPAGNYIFGVKFLSPNKAITNDIYYYTADGITLNPYLAEVVRLRVATAGINMTVPEAESYISGTLNLSNCIPAGDNNWLYINALSEDGINFASRQARFNVPAGTRSINYEIGLPAGAYELNFHSNFFDHGYYGSGTLSNDYKHGRSTISAEEGVSGLDVVIPKPYDDDDDGSYIPVEHSVTINFQRQIGSDEGVFVALIRDDGRFAEIYDGAELFLDPGTTSLTTTLYGDADMDGDLYLAYKIFKDGQETSWNVDNAFLYYSDSNGITPNKKEATPVNGKTNIVVREPNMATISGEIVTNTSLPITGYAYIGAEFVDGIFCTPVDITDGNYTLYIPERYIGEDFEMFFARFRHTLNERTMIYDGELYTLESTQTIDVGAGKYTEISGRINLPDAAPQNGANVRIDMNEHSEQFVIAPDATMLTYSFPASTDAASTGTQIWAYLETYEPFDSTADANTSGTYIRFKETITISGTVSLPEGMTFDEDVNLNISANGSDYGYSNRTILAGESETFYSFKYPLYSHINEIYVNIENNTVPLCRYSAELDGMADEDFTFDIQLSEAKTISGIVTLPEDAVCDGDEINYSVYAETLDGYRYGSEFYTSDPSGENEFSIILPADDDAVYRVGISVYGFPGSDESCIETYQDRFYVSDYVLTNTPANASWVEPDSVINMYFPMKNKLSGTILFDDDAFATGDGLRASLRLQNQWSDNKYVNVEIDSLEEETEYSIYLPSDWQQVAVYLGIWQNDQNGTASGNREDDWVPVKTNVSIGEYVYDSEQGFVSSHFLPAPMFVTVSDELVLPDFTVPEATKVTGKVIFPSDFKSTGTIENVQLSFEPATTGSSAGGCTAFLDSNNNFEAYVPHYLSGDYYVSAYKPWDVGSNILDGNYYHTGEDGISSAVNISSGAVTSGIEIEYETGYAISGTISLPADAVLDESTEINISMHYGQNYTNVYLDSEKRSGSYILAAPKGNTDATDGAMPLAVSVYTYSNEQGEGASCNICSGEFYLTADGTLTQRYEEADVTAVVSDITRNFSLITGVPVTINIDRPEDTYGNIQGEIRLEYSNEEDATDYYYTNTWFSIYNDNDSTSTTIVIPKEYDGKSLYLSYYANSADSYDVYTGGNVWINADGSYSKRFEAATPHLIDGETEIDFTLGRRDQLAMTISGTISFEEGCVLPSDGGYTLYVYAHSPSYGYGSQQSINVTSIKDYDYKITLSDSFAGDYRIYAQLYTGNSNICSTVIYYTSNGVTMNEWDATLVPVDSVGIDIEIPKLTEVSGKILVDEDYQSVEDISEVQVYFMNRNNAQRSTYAKVDADMTYHAYLPYDYAGDCKVGLCLGPTSGMNNLIKDVTYWTEDWITLENGADIQDIDIAVETGYAVSGTIKLPEGAELSDDDVLNYTLSLGNNAGFLQFDSETSEAEFMFGVDKDYFYGCFDGEGSLYSDEVLNAYLGRVEYSKDGDVYYPNSTSYDYSHYFYINEDIDGLELTIPTGVLVNFDLEAPESEYIYGYFQIEELEGRYSNEFDFYYDSGKSKAWYVLPENKIGDTVTFAYFCEGNNDYYIPWYVYLNRDGNFYGVPDKASAFVLKAENNISVTLPLAEEVIYPEAILQSAHPYGNNINETYTYTYEGEGAEDADSLMITFSELTKTEQGYDYIYIIDGNGVETRYTGEALKGITITVPGKTFTVRLTSDGSTEYYGFAITEVRPVVTHTVTFKNYDGSVLESYSILDGQTATYNGITPTRPADSITKYRFTGWDKELFNIKADTVFTAQYEETTIYLESAHPYTTNLNEEYSYTYPEEVDALRITFSDKTETESTHDKIKIYHKDGSLQGTYSGTQLKGQSVTVIGNQFKIKFITDSSVNRYGFEVIGIAPVKDYYTVTFKNYDGTELYSVSVPDGGTAVYSGETPTKVVDGVQYQFTGWNKSLTNVMTDMVVTAQFRLIEYVNVSYYNYDGSLLYTDRILKGGSSVYNGAVPYKAISDDGIGYVFNGWDRNLDSVYSNTAVTAQFARRAVKRITTEAQLREMANDLDGVYVLENDIELTSAWTPIGTAGNEFCGVFDGNGHSIKNVVLNVNSNNDVGFFCNTRYAVLRNLNIEVAISSDYSVYNVFVAPLVVTAHNCDIRNVHVMGSVNLENYNNGSVSGFADEISNSYVDGSSSNVDIYTSGYVSGFSESVTNSTISNSYYSGTLAKAGYDIENIAGFAKVSTFGNTSFDSCYSNMALDVPEGTYISYVVPFVVSSEDANIPVENCYYNKDTFTFDTLIGEDDVALGTGLTDEEMKSQESFEGFDFSMIWEMGEDGYPTLSAAGGKICAEHSFGDWTLVSVATCTEDGVKTRTCSRCGRVERDITKAFGHSFGEWVVTKEPSVLAEGERARVCSVCTTVEVETIEKTEINLTDPNYGLVHFKVVDAISLSPLGNVQIFISTDNDGENTYTTDSSGNLSQVLPIGIVNVSLYKSGYLTRTVKIDVKSGEQTVPTIGISTKPLVEAKLTSKVMSYDEIIDAGIDVTAPGNNHVVKYNVTLSFGTEKADVVTYFNEYSTCVGNTRIPVHLSSGTTVYVYPVSEDFYLMVYGEVQWLKEMFDVEMLIMNNSNTDTVTECTAELILPDGLSLADMVENQQTLVQNVPDIGHSKSHSVHWYVRGDTAGEYNIGANLNAVLAPLGEVINQHYTLEEPIKVYAGNAMHMDIYVPDMTFYGDNYPIKIELTNVSDRTLYNVSNSIKYFKEGKVTHYSDGVVIDQTYFTEDSIARIGASEFKPGDKISIEVQADINFRTSLIRTGLDEIRKYVNNIDDLLNAYEAYLTGAKTVNEAYITLSNMRNTISDINERMAYEGIYAEASQNLLTAVSSFTEMVMVSENQKAFELFDKLKTTGVYNFLVDVCKRGDLFASYHSNRVTKFANTITAIIKSERIVPSNAVSEEMLFELLRRAIESIPIKYYLENVLVSTLDGSTTSIPYTIHTLTPEERFSSVQRLDGYLSSVIETAIGHIDSPWLMNVLSGGSATYEDEEDVTFVQGKANKFAAYDNMGDVVFKVWASADSSALKITCTNENITDTSGVMSFVGSGYITVTALEPGIGTLYIQKGDEIKEYHFTAVADHTCEASAPITIVTPDTDADGYMISLCTICHSIMSVDKHTSACENHLYGEYTVELDSNGEELGIKHRTCSECGHIQYLVIDASIDYMEFILTPESKLDIVEKDTGDGNYLKKVVAGLTAGQLTSNFDNASIEVVKADGTTISASGKIGTGSKLIINSEDGTTSSELTVIVKGDTNGDGNFNILDMIKTFNHVSDSEKPLVGDYAEAARVNTDKNINILDLIVMFKAIQNGEVLK